MQIWFIWFTNVKQQQSVRGVLVLPVQWVLLLLLVQWVWLLSRQAGRQQTRQRANTLHAELQNTYNYNGILPKNPTHTLSNTHTHTQHTHSLHTHSSQEQSFATRPKRKPEKKKLKTKSKSEISDWAKGVARKGYAKGGTEVWGEGIGLAARMRLGIATLTDWKCNTEHVFGY